jgi:hypothetical protein
MIKDAIATAELPLRSVRVENCFEERKRRAAIP